MELGSWTPPSHQNVMPVPVLLVFEPCALLSFLSLFESLQGPSSIKMYSI